MALSRVHKDMPVVVARQRKTYKFDKQLININVITTTASQNDNLLYTCNYPCVVMGLIVNGGSIGVAANTDAVGYQWFVVIVEQGDSINLCAFNGTAYAPEQQVMAFGTGGVSYGSGTQHMIKTKTGRKMKAGDQLYFIVRTDQAVDCRHDYIVQFFLKV